MEIHFNQKRMKFSSIVSENRCWASAPVCRVLATRGPGTKVSWTPCNHVS